MKGKLMLVPVTNPVEEMWVVYEGKLYKYNGVGCDGSMGKFADLAGYPHNIEYSELKQIAVEYKEIARLGKGKDALDSMVLPLHPDDYGVAIGLIGHEIEFDRRMTPKVHGEVAKLSLPTPVRTMEDIPEELRKNYTKEILSEMMIEDDKLGLYDASVKEGSKASLVLKELAQRKEERKKAMRDKMPPKEVAAYISKHTEETAERNGGKLDKESFRLGMYAMWSHLNNKPITGEDVAALLHGIQTIVGEEFHYLEDGDIVFKEKDLLPVLGALGLPAPIWGKSMSIKEWKKSRDDKERI